MKTFSALIMAIIYLFVDILWISVMSSKYYGEQIKRIQGSESSFKPLYAVLAYSTLVIVLFSVCVPLAEAKTYSHPVIAFAIVGFSVYAVFNLTNAAIFERYPYHFVLIDTLWGTTAFATMGLVYDLLKKI